MVVLQCFMLFMMALSMGYTITYTSLLLKQLYRGTFSWSTVKDLLFSICTFISGAIVTGLIQFSLTGIV